MKGVSDHLFSRDLGLLHASAAKRRHQALVGALCRPDAPKGAPRTSTTQGRADGTAAVYIDQMSRWQRLKLLDRIEGRIYSFP